MAPNYEQLSLIQKTEVFDYALDNTTGQDLYRVLWLKSKNSEVWLERRSSYSRSLAVMSMVRQSSLVPSLTRQVGHILGLGDRHPSNLLLDRHSGMVVHIDFGDCFETAMMRDKYPEKVRRRRFAPLADLAQVPFRLTRMLVRNRELMPRITPLSLSTVRCETSRRSDCSVSRAHAARTHVVVGIRVGRVAVRHPAARRPDELVLRLELELGLPIARVVERRRLAPGDRMRVDGRLDFTPRRELAGVVTAEDGCRGRSDGRDPLRRALRPPVRGERAVRVAVRGRQVRGRIVRRPVAPRLVVLAEVVGLLSRVGRVAGRAPGGCEGRLVVRVRVRCRVVGAVSTRRGALTAIERGGIERALV